MVSISALIPAHNEQANISHAINSLQSQGISDIFVVCDNCTDKTAQVAQACGARTLITVDNPHRKSGALNQALDFIQDSPPDLVMIMDADTILDDGWIDTALLQLKDPEVGAVGAVFHADSGQGWLRKCQQLEWVRFAGEVERTNKVFVLSGTAALIRWEALTSVKERYGMAYSPDSITEDFRLTVDLKERGWQLRSPVACSVTTETMPTVKDLFRQRRRWSLGALQTVTRCGLHKHTRIYWFQQFMLLLSIFSMSLLIILTLIYLLLGGLQLSVFWLCIGTIFLVERVVTVWDRPLSDKLFAALVLPELAYALILHASHVAALGQFVTGSTGSWTHLDTA